MDEQIASEFSYTPQRVKGVCEHCGKQMVSHIVKDGARYHVLSYFQVYEAGSGRRETFSQCSEPNCEYNHGPGHCVPLEREADND